MNATASCRTWARFVQLAVGGVCFVLCSAASALTFTFTGSGEVTPIGPPDGDGNLPLIVINTAYDLPGPGVWDLASSFLFNLVTQTGAGSFAFSLGSDSLSGTLTTVAAPEAGGPGFEISYLVTTGTGAYAGMTGSGNALVRLLGDPNLPPTPYLEAGIMNLVPEPSTWMLALAGVAALGALQRRRR